MIRRDWNGYVRFRALHVLGDVDERHDVDRKLTEYGADNVWIEDVVLRSFSGQLLDRSCARDRQEADTHHHAADCDLPVTKLDTIEVEDTQAVGTDETI